MTRTITFVPAHADRPCIRAHGDSVIFSAVFRGSQAHGLQLIHIPDGKTVYIPLTEEYRTGRVYSVRISPFHAEEWLYRYRNGDLWVPDPHATGIRRIRIEAAGDFLPAGSGKEETGAVEVTACCCAPLRVRELFPDGPERPLPPASWQDQVVYSLHVKGLTAAMPASFPGRGTFAGVTAMVPYLKDLGITAVEIMPVYMPLPDRNRTRPFRTMQEALGAWPVSPQGDPLRDMKERPNYWGFGRGLYYALRPDYGNQEEFARMIRALHSAGIRVLLQIFFDKGMQAAQQIDVLTWYVERYGVDGFRLLGHTLSAEAIASAPSLEDTALLCGSFPFDQLREALEAEDQLYSENLENLRPQTLAPEDQKDSPAEDSNGTSVMQAAASVRRGGAVVAHKPAQFPNLLTCGDEFQTLLRRFVKSDDYVMQDFLKEFLSVPEEHGSLRYVTSYEGFTLADLVSYTERHNEANGEFGLDGRADNYSWNCGEEGETDDEGILSLRRRQMRNFLTLLLLAQGTPMLHQGDERCNSQGGNNNPYCQDNEISWVDWTPSAEKAGMTAFTAALLAFRRDHPVFHSSRPFQYIDTLGIGHPDVSLHGEEAWKPDLGPFSHSIGIAFCENYALPERKKNQPASLLYLAVNMYWKELSLALPKLPPNYIWKVILDTETEEGFLQTPVTPGDQHFVRTAPRSIRILRAVLDVDAIVRQFRRERLASVPRAALLKDQRSASFRSMHRSPDAGHRRAVGRTPAALRRIRRLTR